MTVAAHRLPPQNLEAEQGVLGSCLVDNEAIHDVAMLLKPEDFYRDTHQLIYRSIRSLYDESKAVDLVTLQDELRRRGDLGRVGGLDALIAIVNGVPHAANAKYYAQIVRQNAVKRDLIQAADETLRDGYSDEFTAEELLAAAEGRIFGIAEGQSTGETTDLRDALVAAMDRIDERNRDNCPVDGLSSGFDALDDLTGGLRGSQLFVLAGRPSMGKTALALNMCESVAVDQEGAVLFVSLEMSGPELTERILCSRSGVNGGRLRKGGVTEEDMRALGRAYDDLRSGRPVMIDDTPARSMLQIAANARRLKRRQDIKIVMVDYIQLIDPEDAGESRQEQVAKISRRLKQLARELDVPVVALSQLNRAVESREDRRPRMADLRESGAIEQDADVVLLVHRPDYYDPNDQPGLAEIIVAKNRNGATGTAKLQFRKEVARFELFAPGPAF